MEKIRIDSFMAHINGKDEAVKAPFSILDCVRGASCHGEPCVFEFSSRFNVDTSVALSQEIYLKCAGISEGATVALNGAPIFISIGSVKPLLHSVKQYIKHGENLLTVSFNFRGNLLNPERIGVFGEIELLSFERSAIDEVKIKRVYKGSEVLVDVAVTVVGRTDNLHAVAVLAAPSGKMYYSGLSRCKGRISIPDPELWYPGGVGNSSLYKLSVTLYQGEELADVFETRVGLCRLELLNNGDKSVLLANGRECFLIGAEMELCDASFNSSDARISKVIEMAYAAGINALRIRGDFSPSRQFYECADRYGILVFRDLPSFPSVGADERAWRMLAMSEGMQALSSYVSFAFAVSPKDSFAAVDKLIRTSDISVFHIDEGFFENSPSQIRTLRLPISIPSAKTLLPFGESDELNLFSPKLDGLVNDRRELIEMLASISESFLCPSDFSDAVYASQLNAAKELGTNFEELRTNVGSLIGVFVGKLFDYKPSVTGSLIDSSLRPKAAYYALARAAGSVFAAVKIENGDLTVSVHSRKLERASLTLRVLIKDSSNKTHREKSVSFEAEPGAKSVVYKESLDALVGSVQDKFYIRYEILDGTRVEFSDTKQLASPRSYEYEDPKIQAHIEGAGRRFSITLIPSAFASRVFIFFHGVDVVLEDNFIDLTENVPTRVRFSVIGDHFGIDELEERLVLRTVRDIGRPTSCQRYKI